MSKFNCCKNCKYSQKSAYSDVSYWPCRHPESLLVLAHTDELCGGEIPDSYSSCGYFRDVCKGRYFEEKKYTPLSWVIELFKSW